MEIVEKIRDFFWKKSVNQTLKRNCRKKRSIGLLDAKSVGIYTKYENEKQLAQIQSFADSLRKNGTSVMILVYVDSKIKPEKIMENTYLSMFTRQDITFSRIPKIERLNFYKKFRDKEFSILLDLSLDSHYQDIYLLAASHAGFKVGKNVDAWSEKVNDLSFSYPNGTTLTEYIDIIMKYIEKFKLRTNEE